MNATTEQEVITLKGDEAITLWLKGCEVWNQWVQDNPKANIDFSGVDFAPYRAKDKRPQGMKDGDWPFAEFHFPEGEVNFNGAKFGDGFMSFNKAQFGDGNVSFDYAQFGYGLVSFWCAIFGVGDVSFRFAQFGKGIIGFHGAYLGSGRLDFSRTICQGMILFEELQRVSEIKELSFQHATFEGGLVLSAQGKKAFHCVPDLRETKYSHQITLDKVHCRPQKNWFEFLIGKYKDPEDAARLRRLKEISEQNKDHDSALRFKAQELQAARYHTNKNPAGLLLVWCFSFFSNYGRSVLRPLAWLYILYLGGGVLYSPRNKAISECFIFSERKVSSVTKFLGDQDFLKTWECFSAYFEFSRYFEISARQMFPLITVFRDQDFSDIYEKLDGLYSFLAFSQSILSLIFLFLLGLALRNQFRL